MPKGHGIWLTCEWGDWNGFVDDRDPPDKLLVVAGRLARHVEDEHPSEQPRRAVCADCGRYFDDSPDASALQHMIHHSVVEHGPRPPAGAAGQGIITVMQGWRA